jgi:dTDP-4-dehydrorhamnose 3,5-epimerase
MHFQVEPHGETKRVTCTSGAVYDVIVDLRTESATFCRWFGIDLSARNNLTLYVPEGFAHGFMTLTDEAMVQYHISSEYHPQSARGVRWDDPAFDITWPGTPKVMSQRDGGLPDFQVSV